MLSPFFATASYHPHLGNSSSTITQSPHPPISFISLLHLPSFIGPVHTHRHSLAASSNHHLDPPSTIHSSPNPHSRHPIPLGEPSATANPFSLFFPFKAPRTCPKSLPTPLVHRSIHNINIPTKPHVNKTSATLYTYPHAELSTSEYLFLIYGI